MKKTNFKAFTLVEMLIVIVIIGILIAALLPRLQGAQAMARDTARQTALTTIGTAIAAYQLQRGVYPRSGATDAEINDYRKTKATAQDQNDSVISTDTIARTLKAAGIISEVPTDRNISNFVYGIGADMSTASATNGNFAYSVFTKNSKINNGFILMAATEMPGSSNRVVSSGASNLEEGLLDPGTLDMGNVKTCTSLVQVDAPDYGNQDGVCEYKDSSELRYIYMY